MGKILRKRPKHLRGLVYEKPPKESPYYLEFLGRNGKMVKGEVIITEKRLKRLRDRMMKVEEYAFDTETNTLRVKHIGELITVGISICFGEQDTYYIPMYHIFDKYTLKECDVVPIMKDVFSREDVLVIGHNLKFDMHVLATMKMPILSDKLFDTMVGSWMIDENEPKSLKEITSQVYNIPQQHFDEALETVTKKERKALGLGTKKYIPFWSVRIKYGAPYAMADAYWTWNHYVEWEQDGLAEEDMETIYYKGAMPFLKTLYFMERRGANIDRDKLKLMEAEAIKDLEELEFAMFEIAGLTFTPSSPQQLAELLFGYKKYDKTGKNFIGNKHLVDNSFNFPVISTTKTGIPSTGDSELKALSKKKYKRDERKREGLKLVALLRKHKRLSKLKNAFITGLLTQSYEDGKVRPNFNQCGTDSGRLSCSDPNLQQLPRPIELDDPASFEAWYEDNYEDKPSKKVMNNWLKVVPHLIEDKDYATGELDKDMELTTSEEKYLEYISEWYRKNKDSVFWKYYEIRSCFIADTEDDVLIALDFSNLEMRLLAHFSGDPYLMDTFIHDHDAHGATAVNMFSLDCEPDKAKKLYKTLRQIAKTINFLLMYGGSAITLYNTLSDEDAVDENGDPITKEKAQEYYDLYFEKYAGVAEFIKKQKQYAHKKGKVFTVLGRKRRLHNINSSDFKQASKEERLSVNSAIQGSGGDIMMMCQPAIEAEKRLKELGCTQRLQVHDELVFNCPKKHVDEAIEIIKSYMEHPLSRELKIPLRVDADYGRTYADAK